MKKSAVSRGAARTLLLALLASPAASLSDPPESSAATGVRSLVLVGRALLPRDLEIDGTRVGGLSGLAWDEAAGAFWAVSDDRGQYGPVRLYRIRLDLASGPQKETPVSVTVERALPLADAEGRPFAPNSIDTEGLAVVAGGFFVSTEPIVHRGVPAMIGEFGPDGRQKGQLRLPDALLPGQGHGGRENLGFEGLAPTSDGRHLYAAVENALEQDGPAADAGVASPSRILRFDREAGGRPEEFVYVVEPVTPAPPGANAYRMNGLSDLLPLGESRLLVLERQFVDGVGNAVRVWEASLAGATDVSAHDSLRGVSFVPASKRLLFDLADLGVKPENFEGMSFGPRLPDGRRTLVLVSDDNFNPTQDPTTFVVLAFDEAPVSIARRAACRAAPRSSDAAAAFANKNHASASSGSATLHARAASSSTGKNPAAPAASAAALSTPASFGNPATARFRKSFRASSSSTAAYNSIKASASSRPSGFARNAASRSSIFP